MNHLKIVCLYLFLFSFLFFTTARTTLAASFTDTTATYGISNGGTAGASWADVDNDGDFDLLVQTGFGSNTFYQNNGAGVAFTNVTATYGVASTSTGRNGSGSWVDIDSDGDIDFYDVIGSGNSNKIFTNNGAGISMTNATATYGIGDGSTTHIAGSWVDIDSDGDIDLYSVNGGANNKLFINNGAGVAMTDATATYGIADGTTNHRSAAWIDIDNDGDQDLYSANNGANNKLFINNGAGVAMTDATATYGIADGTGTHIASVWGDIDNDGDLDMYTITQGAANKLFINNGAGVAMTDATATYGVGDGTGTDWGASWVDIENDGDMDLVTLNNATNVHLFVNNGVNTTMTESASSYGITDGTPSRSSSHWIDIDSDGDQDLYLNNGDANSNKLYSNPGQGNNYLKVFVENESGVYQYHARVEVDRDGNNDFSSSGSLSVQYQTNSSYSGSQRYAANDPVGTYFGLGSSSSCIYDVRVFLPGVSPSGSPSYSQQNVCPNQTLTTPLDATAPTISNITTTATTPSSSDAVTTMTIAWTTDEASSSKVNYGLTSSYGTSTSETDTSPRVTSHSVTITGLSMCTDYHFQAFSEDASGNSSTSSDISVKTGCKALTPVNTPGSDPYIAPIAGPSVQAYGGGTFSTSPDSSVIISEGSIPFSLDISHTNISSTDYSLFCKRPQGGIGNYHEIWLTDYFNKARILPSVQLKPSIIALRYNQFQLLTARGSMISERSLRMAYSPNCINWIVLPTSVVDTVNNTVAALHKIGGYYAIVSRGVGVTTRAPFVPSVRGITTDTEEETSEITTVPALEEQQEVSEPVSQPTTRPSVEKRNNLEIFFDFIQGSIHNLTNGILH